MEYHTLAQDHRPQLSRIQPLSKPYGNLWAIRYQVSRLPPFKQKTKLSFKKVDVPTIDESIRASKISTSQATLVFELDLKDQSTFSYFCSDFLSNSLNSIEL